MVHINPRRSDDGNYIYMSQKYDYTFASDYVFNYLLSGLKTSQLREVASWFNAKEDFAVQKYGGSFAGDLFVRLCLYHIPLVGRTISCVPLNNTHAQARLSFTLPKIELLSSGWEEVGHLVPNKLYVPKVSTMESGDAFCSMTVNRTKVLIVLQMTIAQDHPVQANGLANIVNAFPASIRNFRRKILLFVTPKYGKLRNEQPLQAVRNEVYSGESHIPTAARNFEQWLYRYELVVDGEE